MPLRGHKLRLLVWGIPKEGSGWMKPLEERSIASVSMAIKLHNGIIKYLFIPVHKQNRERRTVYGLWFFRRK
jgi:hypothetical protein